MWVFKQERLKNRRKNGKELENKGLGRKVSIEMIEDKKKHNKFIYIDQEKNHFKFYFVPGNYNIYRCQQSHDQTNFLQ